MNPARKTAEEIVAKMKTFRYQIHTHECDSDAAVALIEQSLLAAGPRVISDVDFIEMSLDARINASPEDTMKPSRAAVYQAGWDAGFKKCFSMNAIAHLESVWPSEKEWMPQLEQEIQMHLSCEEIAVENLWRVALYRLRAEVLRRLGGK